MGFCNRGPGRRPPPKSIPPEVVSPNPRSVTGSWRRAYPHCRVCHWYPDIALMPPKGCISREGTSEVALEAVRQAVAKAVGGGYCRLQMSSSLALAVRGTVAGCRLGALGGGGGGRYLAPFRCIPAPSPPKPPKCLPPYREFDPAIGVVPARRHSHATSRVGSPGGRYQVAATVEMDRLGLSAARMLQWSPMHPFRPEWLTTMKSETAPRPPIRSPGEPLHGLRGRRRVLSALHIHMTQVPSCSQNGS